MAYSDSRSGHPTLGGRSIRKVARLQKQEISEMDWSTEYRAERKIVDAWVNSLFPNRFNATEINTIYWKCGQTMGQFLPYAQRFDWQIRTDILNKAFNGNARKWEESRGSNLESWVATDVRNLCKYWWRPNLADRSYSMSDRTGENGGLTEGSDQLAFKGGQYATDTDTVGNAEMVGKVKEILGDDFAFFQYRSQHTGEETAAAFGMLPPLVSKRYSAMREMLRTRLG